MSQRASHYEAIPLCPEHHRGATGIHGLGRRAFCATYGISERVLLGRVQEMLGVTV